jgi:hypothetical protein
MRKSRRDDVQPRPGATAAAARPGVAPGKTTLVGAAPTAPLPAGLRARLEGALATDLSAVRVGVDPQVGALGARAVATGNVILFAPGAYQPDSAAGEELIAHEVVHLTQQAEGRVAPTRAAGDAPLNDDPGLEREADDVARRALRGEPVRAAAAPLGAGPAPLQGWFENLGKLDVFAEVGFLADSLIETATRVFKPRPVEHDPGPNGASRELQRILESDRRGDLEAALAALEAAQRDREPMTELDLVTFATAADDYVLEVAIAVTDAMIPALEAKLERLAISEDGDEPLEADPVWSPFADKFNAEFGRIAHAFGLARERDDTRADAVSAERLQFLFTDEQRALLDDYIDTGEIPERLFNGDHVGRATAQQRILIASQILADGKYRPGSFLQEVHARACSHWAKLVYQYAGVSTETSNHGMTGSFDLHGDVVLGEGHLKELFHATPDPSLEPSAAHKAKNPDAYRFGDAPWSKIEQIQPGDWLYTYTSNKSGSGAHSVIFNGWAGPEHTDEPTGFRYRWATTFDQGRPVDGGNHHYVLVGETLFKPAKEKRTAIPINEIQRVAIDAAPIDSLDELTPTVAHQVGKKNKKFVEKLQRKHAPKVFDHGLFMAWLRTQNAGYITKLVTDGRLTEGQAALFAEANASIDEADVISLYQRLVGLDWNAGKLDDKLVATYDADKEADAAAAQREYRWTQAGLTVDLAAAAAEVIGHELELAKIRLELEPLAHDREIAELDDRRDALWRERKQLSAKTQRAERKAKYDQIQALDDQIDALRDDARPHAKEIRALRKRLKEVQRAETKASKRRDRIEGELEALEPTEVYGIAHTHNSIGDVHIVPDGRYENTYGATWDDFLVEPTPAGTK